MATALNRSQTAKCNLCSSPASVQLSLPHTSVWRCENPLCNLEFAYPQPDEFQLRSAYTQLYYPIDNGEHVVPYENTPEFILRQVFQKIDSNFGPLAGKTILDYGCGTGALCRLALQYSARPSGIEADAVARRAISKESRFDAYENLDSLRSARGDARFDYIFLWEVIEHLRTPWRELARLRKMLAPRGRIVISTPNSAGLRARFLKSRWENYVNPTHLYYFAPRSLRRVLELAGFTDIVQLRFTIRYPHHNPARSVAHRTLVALGLDGELLYSAGMGASADVSERVGSE
jgi:SAM-dependent methyltransferase